jgi:hypothetical protein
VKESANGSLTSKKPGDFVSPRFALIRFLTFLAYPFLLQFCIAFSLPSDLRLGIFMPPELGLGALSWPLFSYLPDFIPALRAHCFFFLALPLALRPVFDMIPTYFMLQSSSACGGSLPQNLNMI